MKKGVNVIIPDSQNRILILKRNSHAGFSPLLWDLPGGRVKNNESLEQAVKREAKEETNLRVEPHRDYFCAYYYPGGRQKNAKAITYSFKTQLVSGKVVLNGEHTEFKWISRNEWQILEYTPSVKATPKELFK